MGSTKRKDAPSDILSSKAISDGPPSKRTKSGEEKLAGKEHPQPPIVSRLKEEEPLFPRGGGSVLSPLEHKQIQLQAKNDVLFEQESGSTIGGKTNKRARKQNKPTSKSATSDFVRDGDAVKIESLNFQRLVKGSIVLGQVSAVNPLEVVLSLPNSLSGHVPITAISPQFTAKLEAQATDEGDAGDESDDHEGDGGLELRSLFTIGQFLRAYVTSTFDDATPSTGKAKRLIELSLYPEHANSGLSDADVVENCTVAGSILSMEDHGYIVELCVADSPLRGFLPKKEVDTDTPAERLRRGCVHLFHVTGRSSKGKTAQVSLLASRLGNTKNVPVKAQTISTFLPGTAVDVLVSEVSQRGLAGKVLGHLDVTADVIHSGSGPNGVQLADKFKAGSRVNARVICTFPTAHSPKIGISLLAHVASLAPQLVAGSHPLAHLPSSSTVERCVVRKVEPGIGLFVDVGVEDMPGFVHISRVKDGKVDSLSGANGPYQTGSVHRGRVVGYSALDGVFLLSFEKSVLDNPYLRIEDVPVGEVVDATVEKLVVKEDGISGLVVRLAEGITGFVPQMHLADVRLQHPEKMFREGAPVRARVLSVDAGKRQLRLTLKKTLVNAEGTPAKDISEVSTRQALPGTIVKIIAIGAFVQFYGTLRGFLPVSEMSEAYIRDPNERFRVGQVVTVHVLEADAERGRLIVSCKDPSAFGIERQLALQQLRLGDIVSAKVTQKSEDAVFVELTGSSLRAVLPSSHLMDKPHSLKASAISKIRTGQTLGELVVLEKDERRRALVVSRKPSLVKASRDGRLLTAIDDAKVGSLVHGFVRNLTPTAAFVRFAGNITALLPRSLMAPSMRSQEHFGLHVNQSVVVRIQSVDDNRLVAAMPHSDGGSDSADGAKPPSLPPSSTSAQSAQPGASQEHGTAHLVAKNPVDPELALTNDFTLGKVTKARIISVKKTQLNVALADNVQGRVDVSELFDSWDEIPNPREPLQHFAPNQTLDVRVIGVHDARTHRFLPLSHRTSHSVLELSAKPSSIRLGEGAHYQPLALADAKVDPAQRWLAFVNNNGDDRRLWVNLSPTVRGRIHAAEVSDDSRLGAGLRKNFPVGSAIRVRVLAVDLTSGHLDLSARSALSREAEGGLTWDGVERDAVVHARVTKVTDRQVVLQLSRWVSGPVHMVDLSDDYDQANPLRYSKNDVVRAAVVAVDRSNKKLRLSTRESRVLNSAAPVRDPEITSAAQLEPGNVVRGFVKNVSDKGVFVALGGDVTALVRVSDLSDRFLKEWKDDFQVDQLVRGRVLSVDRAVGHLRLSLKASAVDEDYVPLPEFADFRKGQVVVGKVRKVADFGVFIVLNGSANVSGLCHRTEMAERPVKDATKLYKEGDEVKALVLDVDSAMKRISLGMKPSYFDDGNSDGADSDVHEDAGEDDEEEEESDGDDGDEEDEDDEMQDASSTTLVTRAATHTDEDGSKDAPMTDHTHIPPQGPEASVFSWSADILDAGLDGLDSGLREGGPSDDSERDRSDRKKKRRKAEFQMDRTGEMDAHSPQTAGDFERLLLGQPNSSALWIAYMAFQMQASELDKAREVAERAIASINVREEAEKLNVWVAYLNLEVAYGAEETAQAVFKRACQYNDEQEMHGRMASIWIQSGNHDKAEESFQVMAKKFGSKSSHVWLNYAHFLYTAADAVGRGRALLTRAIQALGNQAHVSLTAKFAALEFRCASGDPERGRTLFEGLLAAYPRKLDLWNQLLDLEMAAAKATNDLTVVRDVFERGSHVKGLKPHQAKAWFRRWAKFEEASGDAKNRARVSAVAGEWARQASARKAATESAHAQSGMP